MNMNDERTNEYDSEYPVYCEQEWAYGKAFTHKAHKWLENVHAFSSVAQKIFKNIVSKN